METRPTEQRFLSSAIEKRAFYKELFSLAIPIGLQNLLTALIGASDALMLGRLTQDAISAVSLANQVSFLMSLFHAALIGGGGALMAQYWGKGDHTMVKHIFCMIIKWAIGISCVFFALTMLFPGKLMRLYTPEPALIQIGASYLKAVAPSYLFVGVTQCYYTVMKLEGKASKSVFISVVTLIADMALDFFLIYGKAGIPKLGANGSAYSTVAVEFLALVWVVAVSFRDSAVHPGRADFRWASREISKDLLSLSLPMLGSALAWGLGFSMHSFLMGHMGSDATAAASIANIAQELVTCICKGISAGTGIMMGKLLGQSLFDKAREYAREFCHISFAVGGIHMLLLCLLAPVVTRFFVLTEAARYNLVIMLLFSGSYVFAYSVNTIIVCGIFPAGGDARYDAVSVFFASWCFALPMAALGLFLFRWPTMIVYILMCSDEIVKLPFIYPRYKKYLWLQNITRDTALQAGPEGGKTI